MAMQPLTLNLPDSLYERLQQRARAAGRSVESEVLEILATAIPEDDGFTPELREALEALALLDDEALWQSARSRLPAEVSVRLEGLHLKRQSEDLSEAEALEATRLLRQYDRTMLIRAEAAVLLKQRGYDVTDPARI